MSGTTRKKSDGPSVLDVVALLTDKPEAQLLRGQVGTVVDQLEQNVVLVEFSDDEGRAYAVAPCAGQELLVLRYVPDAV